MTDVVSRLRSSHEPRPSATTGTGGTAGAPIGLLPIAADLLPREVQAERRGRTGRLVALGLVLVAVIGLAGAWFLAAHGRDAATADLQAAQNQQHSLLAKQRTFDQLVSTRKTATDLRDELAKLMATDTPWSTLLAELGGARGGVVLTSVQGTLPDPGQPSSATTTTTTPDAIGALTVSGTAADKPTIAAFVDALSGLKGLANPFLTSVAQDSDSKGFTFTVQVDVTAALRDTTPHRWTPTSTTGGGK